MCITCSPHCKQGSNNNFIIMSLKTGFGFILQPDLTMIQALKTKNKTKNTVYFTIMSRLNVHFKTI